MAQETQGVIADRTEGARWRPRIAASIMLRSDVQAKPLPRSKKGAADPLGVYPRAAARSRSSSKPRCRGAECIGSRERRSGVGAAACGLSLGRGGPGRPGKL